MATEPIITNERVDDIPVLLTQMERMGIKALIDKDFPTHGNWQGESLGNVAVMQVNTHIITGRPSLKPRSSLGFKAFRNIKKIY
ncbi:MAG: hypothetical protein AAF757_28775 [Cyanobacteria bacterium P01_D01_bin.116]